MDDLKLHIWKIAGALTVLLFLVLLLRVIKPAIEESMEMYSKKEVLFEKVSEAMEWEKRINKIEDERAAIDAFFTGITVEMPDEYLMSAVIESFFGIAESNNVVIRRLQPLDQVDTEMYLKVPFELQVTGTYHNIIKMVNRFEELGYWLNPERIKIRTGMGDDKI